MKDKILIAYFQQKNHQDSRCQTVADDISTALLEKEYSSVEFAIRPVEEYPSDREMFDAVALREKETYYRPALTGKAGHFKDYKIIILVMPNWFDDAPMAVYSFLDDYDFGGTVIVPVVCHGGGGGDKVREAIRKYMPMIFVRKGVDIADGTIDTKAVDEVVKQTLDTKNFE